ncbi:MAG: hypothetical protein AAFZ49_08965, partial [Cyanobacteria bacterium J06659_2]
MLNQDFKEFIQLLNDNQVRYLVIGGYAVALHGYPRYTKDIDIWIEMTSENANRVLQALAQTPNLGGFEPCPPQNWGARGAWITFEFPSKNLLMGFSS